MRYFVQRLFFCFIVIVCITIVVNIALTILLNKKSPEPKDLVLLLFLLYALYINRKNTKSVNNSTVK
jgi:hypothetical protein